MGARWSDSNMGININITKDEHIFIDGATGKVLTPQEFARRNKRVGVAAHNILAAAERAGAEAEEAQKEDIQVTEPTNEES